MSIRNTHSFGIVDILVPGQAAVQPLPQQVRKGQLRILPPSVGQVLFDVFSEAQAFVQLPDQNQAAQPLTSDFRVSGLSFPRNGAGLIVRDVTGAITCPRHRHRAVATS